MAMNTKNKIAIATTSTMGLNGRGNTVYHYSAMYPHCLIAGRTGSGKSYAARSWIYNFLQAYPDAKLTLLDFKGEFGFSEGKRYYTMDRCFEGLEMFLKEMVDRQAVRTIPKTPWLLYIDELAALVTYLDKKNADLFRSRLSTIYMLSRSQNMFTLAGVQRADASTWTAGARDNLGLVMLLGELSKETCDMFSLDKSKLGACPYPGMGHVLVNGSPDSRMRIHTLPIQDMAKMERAIQEALN
ncbi:MAG TPA: DUF87 domain-containing protein [Candidatus Fournierella merdavium]|nr:DUF87 domain-containing protein [Candidatus Fournierella merdavium]